ncbi:protein of unknown function [Sterolibacterium denitrificans]|uniref:Uncharacterized protein n=1 Tax=Sterolibacterium denitrificans TaxID=157592 RepID=A0A7Z7HSB7_9PROT|nr:protein of unknown function [Sterolibacterium denitrificans]
MNCWPSKPPSDVRQVGGIRIPKFRKQGSLLGNDLKPDDVNEERQYGQRRKRIPQMYAPREQQQRHAEVHGIAREAIRACTDDAVGATRCQRIDGGARHAKRNQPPKINTDAKRSDKHNENIPEMPLKRQLRCV